ncbi:hypothetical protein BDW67DRAFT_166845 [Aspergillus spinulosporus]
MLFVAGVTSRDALQLRRKHLKAGDCLPLFQKSRSWPSEAVIPVQMCFPAHGCTATIFCSNGSIYNYRLRMPNFLPTGSLFLELDPILPYDADALLVLRAWGIAVKPCFDSSDVPPRGLFRNSPALIDPCFNCHTRWSSGRLGMRPNSARHAT